MHVGSESPSDGAECSSSLSSILQSPNDVPTRYYLSAKAAAGILRRANRRGKTLPEQLQRALEAIASAVRLGGHVWESGPVPTLRAEAKRGDNEAWIAQPIPIQDGREIEKRQNGLGIADAGAPAYTLDQTGAQAVAQPIYSFDTQFGSNANVFTDLSPTLKASQQSPSVTEQYAVRRLTPLECERLMGWPNDHTRYTDTGKEQADSHRYRQCGNGVASPVAAWIGTHLVRLLEGS